MQKDLTIKIDAEISVSARLEVPPKAKAILVFAHGAGAGMRHKAMEDLSAALHAEKLATLRFQFPYMERGSKRPDSPKIAMAAVAAATEAAAKACPKLPLYAGGKSFGGRMTTNAAAVGMLPKVKGLICFGFPLHPPKAPGVTRAEHFTTLVIPTIFIQGTRDDLCDLKLLREVLAGYKKRPFHLHVVDSADHSYGVLKSSGRKPADVLAEVAQTAASFCRT